MIGLFITLCFLVVRNINGQRSSVPQIISSHPLPVLPLDYRPPYREVSRRYDTPQDIARLSQTSVLPLETPDARTYYDQPERFLEPYTQLYPDTVPPLDQQHFSDYTVPPSRTTEREIPLVQSDHQYFRTNSNFNSQVFPSINVKDNNYQRTSNYPESSVNTEPVDSDISRRVKYNSSPVSTNFTLGRGNTGPPETTLRKNETKRRLFISRTITRTMNRGNKNSTNTSMENSSDANNTVKLEDKPIVGGNSNPVNTTQSLPTSNTYDVTRKPHNTTSKPNVPEITLDERASFEGDQCPKGYVKVNGMCVEAD